MARSPTNGFKKGHKRMGGRAKGTRNHVTVQLKQLLNNLLPEPMLEKMWWKHLHSKDEHVAIKAFEMMLHYRFGKPVITITGEENAPPIKIDISAIPKFREKA
jgi:hypothetical protein